MGWRELAIELGATEGPGPWPKRIARKLGIVDLPGTGSWDRRLAIHLGLEQTTGSWARRMVPVAEAPASGGWTNAFEVADFLAGRGFLNFTAGKFSKFLAALALTAAGTSNTPIAVVGTSIERGIGTPLATNQAPNSYPFQAADLLEDLLGIRVGKGNFIGSGHPTPAVIDSRISLGGWAISSGTSPGGNLLTKTSSGTFAFTPPRAFDRADIYYPTNPSAGFLGTFNANIAGGANTLIATQQADATRRVTLTGALAVQAVNILWASGVGLFTGIDTYENAVKQISMWGLGWSGAASNNYVSGAGGGQNAFNWGPQKGIVQMAPKLTLFDPFTNDMTAFTALATAKANAQQFITAVLAVSDVILAIPPPVAISQATQSEQDQYTAMILELAAENDNLPVIDFRTPWGTYVDGNADGKYSDTVHPSAAGYTDLAVYWADAIHHIVTAFAA